MNDKRTTVRSLPSSTFATRSKTPKPTTVLLVRHGATPTTGRVLPGRARGLHLSEEGRAQAAAVARALSESRRKVAAVYASPLERARETAEPIAAALSRRVEIHRGLLECDFGEWTGAELKKLMKLPEWLTVQRWPSGFRFPGGESFKAMQARIVAAMADLRSRHPGETVVAVSHADPIKAAVADAIGSHLDLFQRILVSPASVTAIAYGPLGPTVLAVNVTRLAELSAP
ncbi:MAG TPA: MSMEG_4193 family putative phosphomutase [Acidimicrobiales bacterium]|nr:MSMEG_4193 family putative phosphomutase [Acidimicrobiales bacterium]